MRGVLNLEAIRNIPQSIKRQADWSSGIAADLSLEIRASDGPVFQRFRDEVQNRLPLAGRGARIEAQLPRDKCGKYTLKAGENSLHTGEVQGSIPCASTIGLKSPH